MVCLYTLASLNFTLCVCKYVTASVTANQLYFHANQIHAVLWSLTRAAVKLSLFQENNVSNSTIHRVNCRTEAVNHLSGSVET